MRSRLPRIKNVISHMKKLLIALAVIALIVIGVLTWAVMNANSLAEKYRPELEKIASKALDTPVKLGKLEASLFPSPAIHAAQFSVGADEKNAGLTLKNLALALKLMPLLGGSLTIQELSLVEPEITLRKDSDGIQIVGLPKKQPQQSRVEKPSETTPPATSDAAAVPGGLAVSLERLKIADARIVFEDSITSKRYSVDKATLESKVVLKGSLIEVPELTLTALLMNKIPLKATGQSISFDSKSGKAALPKFEAVLLGNTIDLSGNYEVLSKNGSITLGTKTGLALASLSALEEFVPKISEFGLSGSVIPTIQATLLENSYSANGKIDLANISAKAGAILVSSLTGSLMVSADPQQQKTSSNNIALKIGPEAVAADLEVAHANSIVRLSKFFVKAFAGDVTVQSNLAIDSKKFDAIVDISSLNLERAMKALKPDSGLSVSGTLSQCKVDLRGTLGASLLSALSGKGNIALKDGTLKGVNLAGSVLRAVNGLPFLTGDLLASVPAKERSAIESPDTVIRSLSANFTIGESTLQTPNLVLESDLFGLDADGNVGFDSELDLHATMRFSQEFSKRMVERNKNVAVLLDGQGRLIIPLTLQGKPPKILFYPNMKKLAETGAKQALEKSAGKLLEKALGKKGKGLEGLLGF